MPIFGHFAFSQLNSTEFLDGEQDTLMLLNRETLHTSKFNNDKTFETLGTRTDVEVNNI